MTSERIGLLEDVGRPDLYIKYDAVQILIGNLRDRPSRGLFATSRTILRGSRLGKAHAELQREITNVLNAHEKEKKKALEAEEEKRALAETAEEQRHAALNVADPKTGYTTLTLIARNRLDENSVQKIRDAIADGALIEVQDGSPSAYPTESINLCYPADPSNLTVLQRAVDNYHSDGVFRFALIKMLVEEFHAEVNGVWNDQEWGWSFTAKKYILKKIGHAKTSLDKALSYADRTDQEAVWYLSLAKYLLEHGALTAKGVVIQHKKDIDKLKKDARAASAEQ